MVAAQALQALGWQVWQALLYAVISLIIGLIWLRVRTRVNIARAREWDRALQDIGVSEDERHKQFVTPGDGIAVFVT